VRRSIPKDLATFLFSLVAFFTFSVVHTIELHSIVAQKRLSDGQENNHSGFRV
jgi:hypothetical protein